jgi:outer membrane protein assembly factor BamD (BamD/ComL family)
MAKKKTTRKELLKSPDEFLTLSSRAAAFLSDHVKALNVIGIGLAIIAVAYLAAHFYMGSVNEKGQNAYNVAYYNLAQKRGPDMTPATLRESAEMFQEVRDEYSMSKAARLALPQIAFVRFSEGQYDEAIGLYMEFIEKVAGEREYESLTRLALAGCYEAKGEIKGAMEVLGPVMEDKEDPLRESAMWHLARLYRLDSKIERSKETLKEFVETYPASPFVSIARSRL